MFGGVSFNRSPFNRRTGEVDPGWRGYAHGESSATAVASLIIGLNAQAHGESSASASMSIDAALSGKAEGVSSARAVATRIIYLSGAAHGVSNARAGQFYIIGTDVLRLMDIDIPVGSEIVIDTERQTVTLDNNNIVYALTDESRFFDLRPGDKLTISGDGSVDVTVLWKDRW